MISVNQALDLVKNQVYKLDKNKTIPTKDALGYVLYRNVFSPIDMPPFRQSAMDGYAVSMHNDQVYKLVGEVKAGDDANPILKKGDAVRIFTGAAVPDDADAVVIQEKVTRSDKQILISDTIKPQANIRPQGEQIKKGDLALLKGTRLSPSGIAYLLSLGITEVNVYKKPLVSIIVTGNELIKPGSELSYGKIYESNGEMLKSALLELNFNEVKLYATEDDFQSTKAIIEKALLNSDLVLISGGISVGDYDFVGKALIDLEVGQLFYKVKQKPGKPLFFGKSKNTYVFALPGNPASALSCFYNYAYIALQKLAGNENAQLIKLRAKVRSNYDKKGDRAQFLKAFFNNDQVEILSSQASSMLNTFAMSNAFVYIPAEVSTVKKGELVDVILIPQS